MQVNDAELTNLQNQLLNPDEPAESEGLDDERDIEALLEEHEDVDQTGVSEEDDASARGLAQKLSRINVVSRRPFAKAWDSHIKQGMAFDNIGVYAMQGNSRDEPTPMEHKCTKTPGCLYKSLYPNDLAYHEDTCRSDRVTQLAAREQKVLIIACSGCDRKFATQKQCTAHERDTHRFPPMACPQGCDPKKLYTSRNNLQTHVRVVHGGRFPATCQHPDCEEKPLLSSGKAYSKHLRVAHGIINGLESKQYIPKCDNALLDQIPKAAPKTDV